MTVDQRKVVMITGGTSGIGLAAAEIFLDSGCNVVLVGRAQCKGQAALEYLHAQADQCKFIAGDVSKAGECERVVKAAVSAFGKLDALVNSAGIYFERAIEEMTETDYDQIMDTNVRGTYFMCRYAAPYLKKSAAGAVVNVSSDAGVNGNFLCTAYCASKGAVTVFTKALALEFAPYGVRVNCVCPGDIDTPLTRVQLHAQGDAEAQLREMSGVYPLGRIGTAREAAEVIFFLATEKASFVTGAAWGVDGGVTAY